MGVGGAGEDKLHVCTSEIQYVPEVLPPSAKIPMVNYELHWRLDKVALIAVALESNYGLTG